MNLPKSISELENFVNNVGMPWNVPLKYAYSTHDVYQGQTVLWASPATSRASIDLVRKNFQKWLATKDSQELLKNIDHRLAVESAMWPEKVINSIVRK